MNDQFITLSSKVDFTSTDDREKLQERYNHAEWKQEQWRKCKTYGDGSCYQLERLRNHDDPGKVGAGYWDSGDLDSAQSGLRWAPRTEWRLLSRRSRGTD